MEPSNSSFHHPFQPYEIQIQFMRALYDCIENGNVGVFESPTGTGKSLSLVCGSLTWLRDTQLRALEKELDTIGKPDDPAWLIHSAREERKRSLLYRQKLLDERISAARSREARGVRRAAEAGRPVKRIRSEHKSTSSLNEGPIEQFELDEYNSGDEDHYAHGNDSKVTGFSKETQALLGKIQPKQQTDSLEPQKGTKIFYCSRTHSQLTQLVGELRKVKLPPAESQDRQAASTVDEQIKHLSLGSRKHLCIHPDVSSLGSNTAINEKCLDLQKPDAPQDKRCSFLPSERNSHLKEDFQARALAKIRDIEELGELGRELKICPYYGSRSAADFSEVH